MKDDMLTLREELHRVTCVYQTALKAWLTTGSDELREMVTVLYERRERLRAEVQSSRE